ncbi:MAG: hypothetical protein HYY09_07075 [Firmicutes bacterium]|nr:hypothetical protein [Bacillota bacterium]
MRFPDERKVELWSSLILFSLLVGYLGLLTLIRSLERAGALSETMMVPVGLAFRYLPPVFLGFMVCAGPQILKAVRPGFPRSILSLDLNLIRALLLGWPGLVLLIYPYAIYVLNLPLRSGGLLEMLLVSQTTRLTGIGAFWAGAALGVSVEQTNSENTDR